MSSQHAHGRESCRASTTHELQQQGFCLILPVMRRNQHLIIRQFGPKRRITSIPCSSLRAARRLRINLRTTDNQRDIELLTGLLTEFSPLDGISMQPVIHMHGPEQ
jgi:hypothetical protein